MKRICRIRVVEAAVSCSESNTACSPSVESTRCANLSPQASLRLPWN